MFFSYYKSRISLWIGRLWPKFLLYKDSQSCFRLRVLVLKVNTFLSSKLQETRGMVWARRAGQEPAVFKAWALALGAAGGAETITAVRGWEATPPPGAGAGPALTGTIGCTAHEPTRGNCLFYFLSLKQDTGQIFASFFLWHKNKNKCAKMKKTIVSCLTGTLAWS